MNDTDDPITASIRRRVNEKFEELDKDAEEFFHNRRLELSKIIEERLQNLSREERDLRDQIEYRLSRIEDRVVRDIRSRAIAIAATVFGTAAAALLFGTFTATREVNNSVITLQNTIISTQGTIKDADKALADQSRKLSEATAELTKKTGELDATKSRLQDLTTQADKAREQLIKIQDDYNRASKNRP